MKDVLSREDFIRSTVAQTMSEYMRKYCAPYTIEQAQDRCIRDATRLADRLYGGTIVDMVDDSKMLPASELLTRSIGNGSRSVVLRQRQRTRR
jgi:hypothetical protein